jgi:CTP synthase
MPEISKTHLGGTMRLGLRPSIFEKGSENWSKIRKLYGNESIVWERHRHRYEINPEYIERLEKGDPSSSSSSNGILERPVTPPTNTRRTTPTTPNLTGWEENVVLEDGKDSKKDKLRFVGKDEKGERMQIMELVGEFSSTF